MIPTGSLAVDAQTPADALFFSQDSLIRPPAVDLAMPPQANRSLTTIQIPFVAADARDPNVSFYASTFAGTVFVTRQGKLVYSLPSGKGEDKKGWTLTETLVGGKAHPRGDGMTPTRVSSFIGNDPSRWQTNQATYDAVALGEVWKGIDVKLRAYGSTTEKLFTVNPGTKPSRIRMQIAGARSLKVNSEGTLVATTDLGDLKFSRPVAYQDTGGVRREVNVAYDIRADGYGFHLGKYDDTQPVTIDPLLQSTFLGDEGVEVITSLAVDPTSGNVYAAGQRASSNESGATIDAFVASLNPDLTEILTVTYLGGTGVEIANSLAVHPTSGDVCVTGSTRSPNFPGTSGGAQNAIGGSCGPRSCEQDAFVARLSADLTVLKQATYLGGSLDDEGNAVAIDSTSSEVYVVGTTQSWRDFPGTSGGAQPVSKCCNDAFVARLNADLTVLKQATYLGGSDSDNAYAVAIHPLSGEVYVAGDTKSLDFPGTAGGAQPTGASVGTPPGAVFMAKDAFIARLSAGLTTLLQATYLGGQQDDIGWALAVHPTSGEIYLAGDTHSLQFPHTGGGAQPSPGVDLASRDGFVARLSGDLTKLRQSTFLGGRIGDAARSVLIHPDSADVYVGGYTASDDFPGTAGGAIPNYFRPADTQEFVAHLNVGLTTLIQSTYLPGGNNRLAALTVSDMTGFIYGAGETSSRLIAGSLGGAQATYGGGIRDGFVSLLTPDLKATPVINALVALTPIKSTFATSNPALNCGAGSFRFTGRLTNTSTVVLSHLEIEVAVLSDGHSLQSADLPPGLVGSVMTIPFTGSYADRLLGPGESVDVPFVICLGTKGLFDFFVNVRGITE
jgi:hypothetical protein